MDCCIFAFNYGYHVLFDVHESGELFLQDLLLDDLSIVFFVVLGPILVFGLETVLIRAFIVFVNHSGVFLVDLDQKLAIKLVPVPLHHIFIIDVSMQIGNEIPTLRVKRVIMFVSLVTQVVQVNHSGLEGVVDLWKGVEHVSSEFFRLLVLKLFHRLYHLPVSFALLGESLDVENSVLDEVVNVHVQELVT